MSLCSGMAPEAAMGMPLFFIAPLLSGIQKAWKGPVIDADLGGGNYIFVPLVVEIVLNNFKTRFTVFYSKDLISVMF